MNEFQLKQFLSHEDLQAAIGLGIMVFGLLIFTGAVLYWIREDARDQLQRAANRAKRPDPPKTGRLYDPGRC